MWQDLKPRSKGINNQENIEKYLRATKLILYINYFNNIFINKYNSLKLITFLENQTYIVFCFSIHYVNTKFLVMHYHMIINKVDCEVSILKKRLTMNWECYIFLE